MSTIHAPGPLARLRTDFPILNRQVNGKRLWGVGKVTSAKLHALGVRTVADAEALGEAGLVSVVGRAAGRHSCTG